MRAPRPRRCSAACRPAGRSPGQRAAPRACKRIAAEKSAWEAELSAWTHERDPYSLEVAADSKHMHPREVLRALEQALPADAMVSTDIGNICSVANSYLRFDKPRSMFAAMSFGNCGYAFPVICGAKLAAPDAPGVRLRRRRRLGHQLQRAAHLRPREDRRDRGGVQ